MTLRPARWSLRTVEASFSKPSMSWTGTSTRSSIGPSSCHCQAVPGRGSRRGAGVGSGGGAEQAAGSRRAGPGIRVRSRGARYQRAAVPAVDRVVQTDLGTGVGVRVDLRDRETLLVRGRRRQLGGVHSGGTVAGQHHGLVLGARTAVDGVGEEGRVDHRPPRQRCAALFGHCPQAVLPVRLAPRTPRGIRGTCAGGRRA